MDCRGKLGIQNYGDLLIKLRKSFRRVRCELQAVGLSMG